MILHLHHLITLPCFSRSSSSLVHLLGDHKKLVELPPQRLDILLFFVVRRMPVMTGASHLRVPISSYRLMHARLLRWCIMTLVHLWRHLMRWRASLSRRHLMMGILRSSMLRVSSLRSWSKFVLKKSLMRRQPAH